MRKIVAGLAMSLDGVVEAPTEDGWMRYDDEMGAIIAAGVAQADAILLGRRTYLDFAALWPAQAGSPMADFMNNTPKYIVSGTLRRLEWANSILLTGDLADAVSRLKRQPGKNIQIPGSPRLVRSLLHLGLLDELALMVHPVVLGRGARLFDEPLQGAPDRRPGSDRLGLELVESRPLSSGVLSVTYRSARG